MIFPRRAATGPTVAGRTDAVQDVGMDKPFLEGLAVHDSCAGVVPDVKSARHLAPNYVFYWTMYRHIANHSKRVTQNITTYINM